MKKKDRIVLKTIKTGEEEFFNLPIELAKKLKVHRNYIYKCITLKRIVKRKYRIYKENHEPQNLDNKVVFIDLRTGKTHGARSIAEAARQMLCHPNALYRRIERKTRNIPLYNRYQFVKFNGRDYLPDTDTRNCGIQILDIANGKITEFNSIAKASRFLMMKYDSSLHSHLKYSKPPRFLYNRFIVKLSHEEFPEGEELQNRIQKKKNNTERFIPDIPLVY